MSTNEPLPPNPDDPWDVSVVIVGDEGATLPPSVTEPGPPEVPPEGSE